jgi:hypothetical protein
MPPTEEQLKAAQVKVDTFNTFRVLRLSQSQFLSSGNLCRAIAVNWIRRILFTGKESYATQRPKLPPPLPPVSGLDRAAMPAAPLTLPAPNMDDQRAEARRDQRLLKKGKTLAAFHELIHDERKVKAQEIDDVAVSFAKSNAKHAKFLRFKEASYAHVAEERFAAATLDDHVYLRARLWLDALLDRMLSLNDARGRPVTVSTAAARKDYEKYHDSRHAQELLHTLGQYPQACFLLDMREAERHIEEIRVRGVHVGDKYKAEGHSIAFRLDRTTDTIVVLEPNFGEYCFHLTDRPHLLDFLASVWNLYAAHNLVLSIGTLSMMGMPVPEEEEEEDE